MATERDRDDVFAWRRLQLERSGFPPPLAARVAHDDHYDLHRLIELVESGQLVHAGDALMTIDEAAEVGGEQAEP